MVIGWSERTPPLNHLLAEGPTSFLSAVTSSITTGGGLSFVFILLSAASTPRMVGNHSRAACPFQPDGLATPLHCTLASPSALPKAMQVRALIFPLSKSSKSLLLARKIPLRQLIQK